MSPMIRRRQRRLALVLTSIALLSSRSIVRADPPPCPGDGPPDIYQGTLADASTTITLDVKPCQTVRFEIGVTPSSPLYGAAVRFEVFNKPGARLYIESWSVGPPETRSSPFSAPWNPPYRGTRGDAGLPGSATLFLDTLVGHSADYVLKVFKVRRPSYNLGAPSLSEAEPILPDTTYRGSIHQFEVGQYFRLMLLPNESFYVSGKIEAHSLYGPLFNIEVFDTGGVMRKRILNQSMAGNTLYKSTSFTNPNTTPTDFIVRLYTQFRPAHDFSINFWIGGNQPLLKLFLNVNDQGDPDDFDPAAPEDESPGYLPCSRVDKTSEALPPAVDGVVQNYLKIVAAYVASSGGRVVAPPPGSNVSIALSQTSAYPGMAMNYGSSSQSDFSMPQPGPFAFNPEDYATADLHCLDYGGRTIITATRGTDTAVMQLPKDESPANALPDNGWKTFKRTLDGVEYVWTPDETVEDSGDAADDQDAVPPGNGTNGDNLTRFEEYRGFVASQRHYRTNPTRKNVFVKEFVSVPGDAEAVELRWIVLFSGEYSSSRRINHNHDGLPGDAGHVDQQAILVFNDGVPPTPLDGTGGAVPCVPPSPGVPFVCHPNIIGITNPVPYEDTSVVNNVKIYLTYIRQQTPPNTNGLTEDPVDSDVIFSVVGHELGHAIGIDHNADITSIMRPVVAIDQDADGIPDWNTIVHMFLANDLTQVRVK